jgi:hypothetical protein
MIGCQVVVIVDRPGFVTAGYVLDEGMDSIGFDFLT